MSEEGCWGSEAREKGGLEYSTCIDPGYLHRPVATATAEELNEVNSNRGLECLFIRCQRPMFSALEPFGSLSAVVS